MYSFSKLFIQNMKYIYKDSSLIKKIITVKMMVSGSKKNMYIMYICI